MYSENTKEHFGKILEEIKQAGFYKEERVIETPQSPTIKVNGKEVLNFCANNYLGLADNQSLIKAAQAGLERWGLGMASVRFICGTQTIHKELEQKIAKFHNADDTILYAACFDANGGVFEPLLGEEDAVISDELNHASIIDGIRLCKAERQRYKHADLNDLERCLQATQSKRLRLISTDGVFSMDGDVAPLKEICDLAEKYNALVMVDECHATGFFGPNGRGAQEHCGVLGRIDLTTSTLGKALGGSIGGFTTGRKELIEMLRQRSRPYLFSNSLPPALVAASIAVIDLLTNTSELRTKLQENTKFFRTEMTNAGFTIIPGFHPIAPVMLGDAVLATNMARELLKEGIYVIGFSYPVVPKGKARIRTQMSAAHTPEQLTRAVEAFRKVGKQFGVVN
ncbi:glycine C-acetyltransferase [bacterium]|nr:glycine C-acetyltransferase [bacterium]